MGITVRALLRQKGSEVVTIEGGDTVINAIRTMVFRKVGSVLVTDPETVCGIFTERDYMHRIVLEGRTSSSTRVADVMTTDIQFARLDDTIEQCMRAMTRRRCRHLPVLNRDRLAGVVSIGDCVAHLCRELSVENALLYDYIGGPWPPSP